MYLNDVLEGSARAVAAEKAEGAILAPDGGFGRLLAPDFAAQKAGAEPGTTPMFDPDILSQAADEKGVVLGNGINWGMRTGVLGPDGNLVPGSDRYTLDEVLQYLSADPNFKWEQEWAPNAKGHPLTDFLRAYEKWADPVQAPTIEKPSTGLDFMGGIMGGIDRALGGSGFRVENPVSSAVTALRTGPFRAAQGQQGMSSVQTVALSKLMASPGYSGKIPANATNQYLAKAVATVAGPGAASAIPLIDSSRTPEETAKYLVQLGVITQEQKDAVARELGRMVQEMVNATKWVK